MSSISNSSLLLQVAQIDGCETLLKSFRPQYLEYVLERVRTQQEYVSLTPEGCAQKVLEKCKASAAALEKANMLHETMDRRHYEELVRSETAYITRGVDKKKGRKVIFFRTGTFFRGVWRYRPNSPRGDAFVAAINFWIKASIANIPLDAEGEKLQIIMILDLSESGCLDFSPTMQLKSVEFSFAMLLPLPPVVLIVGAPPACGMFVKFLRACLPSSLQYCIETVDDRNDIEKYVGPNDTPSWWYDDDSTQKGV